MALRDGNEPFVRGIPRWAGYRYCLQTLIDEHRRCAGAVFNMKVWAGNKALIKVIKRRAAA